MYKKFPFMNNFDIFKKAIVWNIHALRILTGTCFIDSICQPVMMTPTVEADNEFQVCKSTGWSVITIQGAARPRSMTALKDGWK